MSRKEKSSRFSMRRQKSYLTAGVIALVAVIAMAGIYYKKTSSQKAEQQEAVIMAESEWDDGETSGSSETNSGSAGKNDSVNRAAESETDGNGVTGKSDTDEETGSTDKDGDDTTDVSKNSTGEDQTESEESGTGTDASQSTALLSGQEETAEITGTTEASVETSAAAVAAEPEFSESDTLGWPISGNILMNYSMDQTVYFATLDQYKYNPALVIEGAVNDKVTASAAGTVLNVETTEETGETVSVDIGGGFQLIYGQLKDVQVSAGDSVEKGALLGFVNEPTKYYSVEGSNLYFAMLKDGEPVNPMNYLE